MMVPFSRRWRVAAVIGLFAVSSAHAVDTDSLTLQRAIAAALHGNPALQTFEFQFKAQDARVLQAGLRPAPEASVTLENFAGSGETRGLDSVEATFALSQVVELGDKRDARIGAAQATLGALDAERRAAQLDVLAEVTRRFIAVAQGQARLKLAQDAVGLAEHTVAASERRVNAAKAPHAELDRARIALDRTRLELRAVGVDLDTARKQLSATWGESQPLIEGQSFGEVRADLYSLPSPGDFADLSARLASNPDLLRFVSESRLRDAELRLANSLRRPDLTLGAGLRRIEASRDQALVASFSMPLFAGSRAEAGVAEAQARRSLVDAEQRVAIVKAQATLYELHRQLMRAVTEAQTLRDDIQPRSAEALKETEYAYERGRYGYLELVDAQREYLAVQAALIDAAAGAHNLRTEIERLTNAPLNESDGRPRAEVDDAHTQQADTNAQPVGRNRSNAVHGPQPEQRGTDVNTAIGSIDAASGLRMQGEQPGEGGQAQSRRQQEPPATPLLEPEVRQVAPDDLREGRARE